MALTAGTLSINSVQSTTDSLVATAATGGTGPYTQQWNRSTTTGFTPGAGTVIAGATGLTLNDSGLIPNTNYFYKVVYTDTGAGNATITSAQLPVSTTAQGFNQNQFAQSVGLGMADQKFNFNTEPVMIDASQTAPLYAGSAVKILPGSGSGANTIPKVVGCTANSDSVFGFIYFDAKTVSFMGSQVAFPANNLAEIASAGNVIYLYATGPITQGSRVTLDITTQGGVTAYVASSGGSIVGWAYDGAAVGGQLIRIKLLCPSFAVA